MDVVVDGVSVASRIFEWWLAGGWADDGLYVSQRGLKDSF